MSSTGAHNGRLVMGNLAGTVGVNAGGTWAEDTSPISSLESSLECKLRVGLNEGEGLTMTEGASEEQKGPRVETTLEFKPLERVGDDN